MTNRLFEPARSALSVRQDTIVGRLIARRGRVLNPFKVWIHAPGVAEGMEMLGTHLNTRSSLGAQETELVALSVAVYWRSPFVIRAHTRKAREAGLPDEIVNAILDRDPYTPSEPRLAAVAALVSDALLSGGEITDAAFQRYETELGREAIAEVLALIGYYTSAAIALCLHDVQPPQSPQT